MGCLKVDISSVSGNTDVVVRESSSISFTIDIIRKKICSCFDLLIDCINSIILSVDAVNDSFSVDTEDAYPAVMIDVGITCMTNLGTEYFLRVLDGYLLTVEGCYIKVLKS